LSLLLPSRPNSEWEREAAALETLEARLGLATDVLVVRERASCDIGAVTLVIVTVVAAIGAHYGLLVVEPGKG
jgi:hypothetical protein